MFLTKCHESLWESKESHEISLLTKTGQIHTQNCAYSSKRFMVTPTTVCVWPALEIHGLKVTRSFLIQTCVREVKRLKVYWYLQAIYLPSTSVESDPRAPSGP